MNLFFSLKQNGRIPHVSSNATILANRYSFRLVRRAPARAQPYGMHAVIPEAAVPTQEPVRASHVPQQVLPKQKTVSVDTDKRGFLKLAGILGLGVAAASALPQTAQAYVMGSSPTSGVVGLKNAANTRIDPATEGGNLATIAAKDFATQTTLDLIRVNSDKFNFTGQDLKVVNSGGGGGGASEVGILDKTNTQINPATDDSVILLRRMVKLMESQATVDVANRQRITLDAWGAGVLLGNGTSASSPRVAIGSDSTLGTVSSVTNVATIGSYAAQQMYGDVAHDVYANALRRHLVFS